MAAKPTPPETPSAEVESEAPATGKMSRLKRLFTKHWILGLFILSLFGHGLLVMCWPAAVGAKPATPTEIELGAFRFINHEKNSRLAQADFKLHVSLLLGTEKAGGGRLNDKKFLVQQGIEELLRQAHPADFDDPTLAELKRQIQEKVNESVEMRTVEAVIITQLQTQDRAVPAKTSVASFEQSLEPSKVQPVKSSSASADAKPAADPMPPADPSLSADSTAK